MTSRPALMARTLLGACFLAIMAGQAVAQLAAPPASVTLDLQASPAPSGEVFAIGFLADAAPGHQLQLYLPYQRYVEGVLQRPVELVPYGDVRGMILAIQRQDVDYAMGPASVLAAAHRHCDCVVPLASQPNANGSQGLYSVVIAQEGGTISAAADLPSTHITIVGEQSVLAHRVGLSDLWREEIRLDEANTTFAPSIEEAVDRLNAGQTDAILTWSRQSEGAVLFDQEPVATLPDDVRGNLRIIWRSRPVPNHSHFVHSSLDNDLKETLADLLLRVAGTDGDAFDAIDRGSGRAFVERQIADYQPLLDAFTFWDRLETP